MPISDVTAKPIEPSHRAEKHRSDKAVTSPRAEDRVTLSSGMSIQQINQHLTTAIGKKVSGMLADAGIDIQATAGQDWSPEATAGRIFSGVTGLLGVWRNQHPKMSEEDIISSFEKTVRGAVNQGYSEAISILSAANMAEGTETIAKQTISLVHEKFDAFFAERRAELQPTKTES